MRLGMHIPFTGNDGAPFDSHGVAERAQMVEAAGFSGVWVGDASYRGIGTWPDPLLWLLAVAASTRKLEVGTAIYQAALRSPVELAQRLMSLRALTGDRLTLGVGPGSTEKDYAAFGLSFENRYAYFYEHLDIVRRLCAGERVGEAELRPWPSVTGPPRLALGAWGSKVSLKRATRQFDGWICSAGKTSLSTMSEGLKIYRDLGGKRALVASCTIDLDGPREPLEDDQYFHLHCSDTEAAERLHALAELGFDDLILSIRKPGRPFYDPADVTVETLERIRSLSPWDDRSPFLETRLGREAS
jgi:alkanesulfonate monooxygenase SsuD/methylene tetrahydromethanopterin reductase-like flavin-dependent oxidoreductase (luciferase family)